MTLFKAVIGLHIAAAMLSVALFALRYWWRWRDDPRLQWRWLRLAPHGVDSLLLLSGLGLMTITDTLPFTHQGAWLTEKLFGVIIYIVLGFVALGRRCPRRQQTGFIAFLLALVVVCIIVKLAITQAPLLR